MPRKNASAKRPAPDNDTEPPSKKVNTGHTDLKKNLVEPSETSGNKTDVELNLGNDDPRSASEATSSISETLTTKPAFLRLPAEIRNIIYEYVLAAHWIIPYSAFYRGCPRAYNIKSRRSILYCDLGEEGVVNPFDWIRLISLLSVCHQIYHETRVLPYSLNMFEVKSGMKFKSWVMALNTDQGSAITTLYFDALKWRWAFASTKGQEILDLLPHLSVLVCNFDYLRKYRSMGRPQEEQDWIQQYADERGLELMIV